MQTFHMQKKYGNYGDAFDYVDAGFQWLLGDYDIATVRKAFAEYLRKYEDLPAPASILKIIREWREASVSSWFPAPTVISLPESEEERQERIDGMEEVLKRVKGYENPGEE